tara:strand:+ start:294 stop:407 length:114 start_codon:yes stop_codon:yes gene_type:complete
MNWKDILKYSKENECRECKGQKGWLGIDGCNCLDEEE